MAERVEMSYRQALGRAAELLKAANRIAILSHVSPDGDTIGSAYALCRALRKMGRSAAVFCSDPLPGKYAYLYGELEEQVFEPDLIVSSDIATENLFGDQLSAYKGRVELAIDHHPSNDHFAAFTLLNPGAAATCEIMTDLIHLLNVEIEKDIANCIYTGLSTDTGCFRYSNTTPKTLRTAAEMIEKGAESAKINKLLFETKSRSRMMIESMALGTLDYYYEGRVAVISVTRAMCEKAGVDENELEGIPSIPARIEGVLAGVTLKEKDGYYRISVRTNGDLNASEICRTLGGGGHFSAAGCQIERQTLAQATETILNAIGAAIKQI